MSSQNGDKARYGRLRKKKLARRVTNRAMKKLLIAPAVVEILVKPVD
jgi:hypothetical protein